MFGMEGCNIKKLNNVAIEEQYQAKLSLCLTKHHAMNTMGAEV
jgi:hypothetical protein